MVKKGRRGMEEFTLTELTERFQLFNRAANKSIKTLEWYTTGISRFQWYLREQLDREPSLADVTPLTVRGFIVALQEGKAPPTHSFTSKNQTNLSAETINSYVRALRGFTHFLYDEGLTPNWLLEKVKAPKVDQKLKGVIEADDIRRVFAAFNPRTFLGYRNIAMIAVMLDGGLRLSELTGIKQEDCNLMQGYIKVLGKGRKERVVGVSDDAIEAIQQYLKYRPELDSPYVFVTVDGSRLTKNALGSIFYRLRTKLGIAKLHPHLLRHASATLHLMNGEDLVTLQRQLGHSHITVTQQYIGNVVGAQIKAHRETSPLKSLGIKFSSRRTRRSSS